MIVESVDRSAHRKHRKSQAFGGKLEWALSHARANKHASIENMENKDGKI